MSKKISESEILKRVKSLDLNLTEAVATFPADHALVYRSEIVERWLSHELPQWQTLSEEDLRRFDSQAPLWYATKADQHYGPLTAEFLSTYEHDVSCFSLALKRKARSVDFRALNLERPVAPKVFVSRRAPRKALRHLVPLRNESSILMAMTLDISTLGMGLYLRSPLAKGETFHFDFRTFGLDTNSESVVKVESVSPFKAGVRCGTSFVDLHRRDFKALENWLGTF